MDQITVKDQSQTFTPCPTGMQHAVCVDVVDLGETVDQYQDQPARIVKKIALVFQSDEENPATGKRYEPAIELTATFGPKAKLRKLLGAWRGKPYSDEEARTVGAPLHKLVGVNASINVLHKESGAGRTYAIIDTIAPPMKGQSKIVPHDYVRSDHWQKRREDYATKVAEFKKNAPSANHLGYEEMPTSLRDDSDENLPF